jgi:hypothetical protein
MLRGGRDSDYYLVIGDIEVGASLTGAFIGKRLDRSDIDETIGLRDLQEMRNLRYALDQAIASIEHDWPNNKY